MFTQSLSTGREAVELEGWGTGLGNLSRALQYPMEAVVSCQCIWQRLSQVSKTIVGNQ